MDLLKTIENDVMKQKEEEVQNNFERVADFRSFISETQPEPDVSGKLKLCCVSAERLNGGHGTRFAGIDASQHTEFEPTFNALEDLSPLKKKRYVAQVTVWDGKAVKGSYVKGNVDFQPGAVYVFHKVDSVGFYADIAKGSVQYVRGKNSKIVEAQALVKKRKLNEATKKSGKAKATTTPPFKRALFPAVLENDVSMAMQEKEGEPRDAVSTRSK